ncbi:MAG: hypothetical protein Q3999_01665 [Buchananella hordeovulneris]|nr:hypothetical protein [Buchananella hordeovulneris]
MAGEAMRRAALNAPTEGKHRPAVVSTRGGKWAARKAVRAASLALGVVLIAGGALTQMSRPTVAVPAAAQQVGEEDGKEAGVQAQRGQQDAVARQRGRAGGAEERRQGGSADSARGGRGRAGPQEASGHGPEGEAAVRPGGCEQFAVLSERRDAAIAARDAHQLAAVYAPGAVARARDVELIGALTRDGIEVRGLSNRLAACTEMGEQELEVSMQQLAYQWRVGTGHWQEAPATAPQVLRVRLEDGKVAELTPQEGR